MNQDPSPHVIWILVDEWRADVLGLRNPTVQTPALDRLAGRGHLFDSVLCESPVCQPSRASMYTGRFVRDHGLIDNELSARAGTATFPLASEQSHFARLRAAGYVTHGIGKLNTRFPMAVLRDRLAGRHVRDLSELVGTQHLAELEAGSLAWGFDSFLEEGDKLELALWDSGYTDSLRDRGKLRSWRESVLRTSSAYLTTFFGGGDGPISDGPEIEREDLQVDETLDAYIARQAIQTIRNHDSDAPLGLYVGFVGPHPPFSAPPSTNYEYDAASMALGPMERPVIPDNAWGEYLRWVIRRGGSDDYTVEDTRTALAQYFSACSQLDDSIGRIVAEVDARGWSDNTVILFTGDHGEMLGNHSMVQKRVFYRPAVEVPAILSMPDRFTVTEQPAQNIDLLATVLDAAGASLDGHQGRSLIRSGVEPRPYQVSQICGFSMFQTADWKLIVTDEDRVPQLLIDRRNDPDELHDALQTREGARVAVDLVDTHVAEFLGCSDDGRR